MRVITLILSSLWVLVAAPNLFANECPDEIRKLSRVLERHFDPSLYTIQESTLAIIRDAQLNIDGLESPFPSGQAEAVYYPQRQESLGDLENLQLLLQSDSELTAYPLFHSFPQTQLLTMPQNLYEKALILSRVNSMLAYYREQYDEESFGYFSLIGEQGINDFINDFEATMHKAHSEELLELIVEYQQQQKIPFL